MVYKDILIKTVLGIFVAALLCSFTAQELSEEVDLVKIRDKRQGNKVIFLHIRVQTDMDQAFEMFTDSDKIHWLAPAADIEPNVGGRYELFFDLNDRKKNNTVGCRITAYEKGRILSFDWAGPPQFEKQMNRAKPMTHVTVTFICCDRKLKKCTDIYIIHSGWGDGPEWDKARRWFTKAWKGALENLKKEIANR
jgi:hypothetical protein